MKTRHLAQLATTTCALALIAGQATAGGIDRSGQGVNILFEDGNFAQFTYTYVDPDVSADAMPAVPAISFPGAQASNDVAQSYGMTSFGYKHQLTDKIDLAITYDEPFGAHIHYKDGPLSAAINGLDGVAFLLYDGLAEVNTKAFTTLMQYNFGNGFSIHAGARALTVKGLIQSGDGILDAESDYDWGGVIGVAYEKPEIALRVALTYSSAITSTLDGVHQEVAATGPGGTMVATGTATASSFDVKFPESVNLDFQTGIAANTLIFGSIRWVGWNGFSLQTVDSTSATVDWVDFDDDTITYSFGIGRKINEKLSLALRFGYEKAGKRPTTTALAPTTGSKSIGIGATYQLTEKVSISGGVSYAIPGDQYYQLAAPTDLANMNFTDNKAIGAGFRIGIQF